MYMYVNKYVELAQWGIALYKNVRICCCSLIWGIPIVDSVEKTKYDKARTVVCDTCASIVLYNDTHVHVLFVPRAMHMDTELCT